MTGQGQVSAEGKEAGKGLGAHELLGLAGGVAEDSILTTAVSSFPCWAVIPGTVAQVEAPC